MKFAREAPTKIGPFFTNRFSAKLASKIPENPAKFDFFFRDLPEALNRYYLSRRHGGLMVSVLDSVAGQSGFESWPGTLCCVLGQGT